MYRGWAQAAFFRERDGDLAPAEVGALPLILVRREGAVRAYHATCPHRGAHLGYGGRLEQGAVVCPFHGRRIRLGLDERDPYCVEGYRTLDAGGSVYVLLDERYDHGFGAFMSRVAETHYLIPGFEIEARIAPEYVIENVFDVDHFQGVHGVTKRPRLRWRSGESGELIVEGTFELERPNEWQGSAHEAGAAAPMHFRARVFSPTLVATELGSAESPNVVVTAATPTPEGDCVIRVTVAMARTPDGIAPTVLAVGSLMSGTRTAFEQDLEIWEHLDRSAPSHFAPSDELVVAYHDFCRRFQEPVEV